MDDNGELGYISSVSPFVQPKAEPSIDAPDEKTLERLVRVLEGQIKLYHTLDGVKQFDKSLSIKQRFELCDHYVQLLAGLLGSIKNTIEGIKENQNARR